MPEIFFTNSINFLKIVHPLHLKDIFTSPQTDKRFFNQNEKRNMTTMIKNKNIIIMVDIQSTFSFPSHLSRIFLLLLILLIALFILNVLQHCCFFLCGASKMNILF